MPDLSNFDTLVTLVAALVGIVVAVTQLTSAARLQRKISFWTEQIVSSSFDTDRTLAVSVRRDTTARLLALEAYPAYRFLIPSLFVLSGVLLGVLTGYELGGVLPADLTLDNIPSGATILLAIPVGVLILVGGTFELARVMRWRVRIVWKYLNGEALRRGRTAHVAGDGVIHVEEAQGDISMSWRQLAGLYLFAFASFATITLISLEIGAGYRAALEAFPWLVIVIPLSGTVAFIGVLMMEDIFSGERLRWEHPRPLPPANEPTSTETETKSNIGGWRRFVRLLRSRTRPR